jgi:bacillithiol biosynthesis deacetylase BshB1
MKPDLTSLERCDIVAFTAHPDDMELGCGGTLALANRQGLRAGAVDFTRAELSTRGTPEQRAQEAKAAASALGLTCRVNLGFPDGHVHDNDESRKAVVQVLRRMRPRVVLAPPLEDHHADHIAVATVVSRSFYLAGVEKYAPGDEPWRPNALLHFLGSRAAIPQLVVDITEVYQQRLEAIRCYASQFHQEDSTERSTRISHPGFLGAIDGVARHYGSLIGAAYGEAYTTTEPLGVANLVELYSRTPWKEDPPERGE